ncbi:hypothetical protein VFPFJ_06483 [Purpureocillium lilacinum]|uniref:Uncharacterized protein n=1 Tax=Purpureocillium lilacinum TaxID=33203 RepID=A0A179HKS1_PURLI|nr:hypothetical protein VFPFJ_06483 [Purpureocillium lilacinum]OAQ90070.1 hypothetical protein VFPFJ_06483 [Purpureocillium lilacinum]
MLPTCTNARRSPYPGCRPSSQVCCWWLTTLHVDDAMRLPVLLQPPKQPLFKPSTSQEQSWALQDLLQSLYAVHASFNTFTQSYSYMSMSSRMRKPSAWARRRSTGDSCAASPVSSIVTVPHLTRLPSHPLCSPLLVTR